MKTIFITFIIACALLLYYKMYNGRKIGEDINNQQTKTQQTEMPYPERICRLYAQKISKNYYPDTDKLNEVYEHEYLTCVQKILRKED